jgi:hypothetical protein
MKEKIIKYPSATIEIQNKIYINSTYDTNGNWVNWEFEWWTMSEEEIEHQKLLKRLEKILEL